MQKIRRYMTRDLLLFSHVKVPGNKNTRYVSSAGTMWTLSHTARTVAALLGSYWCDTTRQPYIFGSLQCSALVKFWGALTKSTILTDSTEWACNILGVRRLTFLRRQPSPSAPLPGEVGYCPAMKECIIVKCTSISKAKRKGLNYAQDDTTGKAGSLSLCWTQSRESKFSLWVGQQALIGINGWNKFKTHTHIHTLNAPNTHSHRHSVSQLWALGAHLVEKV
jgi:hypothetical protein